MATTMRAVLLKGHGGYDQLEYREDVPVPSPNPDEVLVRVGAAAVNNTDVNMRVGWYSRLVDKATASQSVDGVSADAVAADAGWSGQAYRFPRIQGADACGRIEAVGADVQSLRPGLRVLIEPIVRRDPVDRSAEYLGSECDGAFAEYVCVPATAAHPIECGLSDVELASFPCSYGAAEHMVSRARVGSSDVVLVTGASGGVGTAAIQLAARRGATVIAIAAVDKADALRVLGAETVLDRGADIVGLLGRRSVTTVIDVVGGPRFPQLIDVLRPYGCYATAGAIAGPMVGLDLRMLYLKDLRLEGCTIFKPGLFADVVSYVERGEIRPVVGAVFALQDMVEAQNAFLSKRHVGKIVLTV